MEKNKGISKMITVKDVTKEVFESCATTQPYEHPTAGKIVSAAQIKRLCPSCAPLLKNIGRTVSTGIVKVDEDEAKSLGIKNYGNPRLGIRMFTEEGCELIGKRLPASDRKQFFMIIKCVFHRQEVQDILYPDRRSESKQSSKEQLPCNHNENALVQIGKLLVLQTEAVREQTKALKQIAASMSVIQELLEKSQNQLTVPIDNVEANLAVKKEDVGSFDIPAHLKLKRGEKEPVYKMDSNALQRYKEEVLEGIPNALHNSVLHYAYNRMRDKYGVPVDTYRNEYFADTGKTAKNSLQIAHWLEFRNPAIRGLLKSCAHTAIEKNVFNIETAEA